MAIKFNPAQGSILICDFSGFKTPEMVKRRPVVVVSPRLRTRNNLCTVVPVSTTPPDRVMPYHFKLHIEPPLPDPYPEPQVWVKADMVYTVSYDRLYLPSNGKDASGKRIYDQRIIDAADLLKIQACILHALGLTTLTDYL